jgi:hypothetical protein
MTDISRRAFLGGLAATAVTAKMAVEIGWHYPAGPVGGEVHVWTEEEQRRFTEYVLDTWSKYGARVIDRGGSLGVKIEGERPGEQVRFRIAPDWRERSGWDRKVTQA